MLEFETRPLQFHSLLHFSPSLPPIPIILRATLPRASRGFAIHVVLVHRLIEVSLIQRTIGSCISGGTHMDCS